MGAYEKVLKARNSNRPSGAFFVNRMITKFVEFHGDRRFSDDGAIVGGIGYLNDMPVTIIAMERGDDVNERIKRNFGCPSPECYR